jgi:hypothetical protein
MNFRPAVPSDFPPALTPFAPSTSNVHPHDPCFFAAAKNWLIQQKYKSGKCETAEQDRPVPPIETEKSAARRNRNELRHELTSRKSARHPKVKEFG